MGSPTVVHGSRRKEKEGKRGARGGVIALGATVEFSRSRTARVPRQGYVLARIRERASERASQRVFASLMLTNEGYIIIGETAERIPFIDLSRNMQEPFYGFVPLVSEQSHPARTRSFRDILLRVARSSSVSPPSLSPPYPPPPFRRS